MTDLSVPVGALPHVDEHEIEVAAGIDDVWAALLQLDGSFTGPLVAAFVRVIGCVYRDRGGPRPLTEGSTMPGFQVATAVARSELVLAGRHHFSTYALAFRIESLGADRARLSAESRAAFPGLAGGMYRRLVIGTGAHVLAVRRLLRGIGRVAESRSARARRQPS